MNEQGNIFCIYTKSNCHNIFCGYNKPVFTVIESPLFQKQVADVWTEADRLDFISFIAANPEAGDVIPGAQGARKVRWSVAGKGKRGGARVVYFNVAAEEIVLLVTVYTKAEKANILPKEIKR